MQYLIEEALLLRLELEDAIEADGEPSREAEAIAASVARRDELMRRAGIPVVVS